MIELFDSHSHYNDEKFTENLQELIQKTYEAGITKWICAGYSVESSKKAVEIAKQNKPIYAICGISPNDVPQEEKQGVKNIEEEIKKQISEIEQLLKQDKKIVAVGEIGLDYYWNKENKQIQKEIFQKQIQLANKYQLPIVIHTREAVEDTIEMIKQNPVNKKGIFHCCPMNQELIKEALKLEYYISFAGPVTFKNAKNAEQIVKMVPLEKMLIETDSPYLAPEPVRGTKNNSINVKYIAQKIADFKQISLQEVAKVTYQNAEKIFNLEK